MTKNTVFCLFFLTISSFLVAQAPKTPKNPLDEFSSISEAKSAFVKALSRKDKADRVWAGYGLALVYKAENDPQKGYQSANNALLELKEVSEKDREKLRKKAVSGIKIKELLDTLSVEGYRRAEKTNSFEMWSQFLETYQRPAARTPLSWRWDTAVARRNRGFVTNWAAEKNADTLAAQLIRFAPEFKRQNTEGWQNAWLKHLKMSFSAQNWGDLDKYFAKYPMHPAAKDAARSSFQKAITSANEQTFIAFYNENKQSVFGSICADSIALKAIPAIAQRNRLAEMLKFVRKYPESTALHILDEKLSNNIAEYQKVVPFLDATAPLDVANLPLTEEAIYRVFWSYGTPEILNTFPKYIKNGHLSEKLEADLLILKGGEKVENDEEINAFLEKAGATDRAYKLLVAFITPLLQSKEYDNALSVVKEKAAFFPKNDIRITELINVLERPTDPSIKTMRLDDNVNSRIDDEYSPVLSADNKYLYFCRRRTNEDIYMTRRASSKDNWEIAQPVKALISGANEAPISVSADGSRLLLFKNGVLYATEKDDSSAWKPIKALPQTINAASWQGEATFSPDGNVIIFESASRKDVIGLTEFCEQNNKFFGNCSNIDIYISFRIGKTDNWSTAINLGKTINTPFRDRSPFLHPDGKTLYFCSEGRGTLGGLDLYKTTRLDSTWLNWSTPVHVGREINTIEDDWGYKVSTDGRFAFYASNDDIWVATPLPEIARPIPMIIKSGKITSMSGNALPQARIVIRNAITNDTLNVVRPDPITGEYSVIVPAEGTYDVVIEDEKKEILPQTIRIDPPSVSKDNSIERQEDITIITKQDLSKGGAAFTFKNLNFDFNKADIRPESFAELNRWADALKGLDFKAVIIGHTDNVGNDAANLDLSKRRAEAARNYLIQRGVSPERLSAEGRGETEPLVDNNTEENRFTNRRVEIKILK